MRTSKKDIKVKVKVKDADQLPEDIKVEVEIQAEFVGEPETELIDKPISPT